MNWLDSNAGEVVGHNGDDNNSNIMAMDLHASGADPGEAKWVNFHPPFSEPPSFSLFFSYPSNIEIIFDFSDFSD